MQDTQFGKVVVLSGGWSNEREVSLTSGQDVLSALRAKGVDAGLLDIKRECMVQQLQALDCDRVFIALHGEDGESGLLQAVLDALHIPYPGSDVSACAFSWDKLRAKLLWQAAGLPIAAWRELTAKSDWQAVGTDLGLPLFVKPTKSGSSVGVSRVTRIDELARAYAIAREHSAAVIAEPAYEGGEYFIGILNGQALPAVKTEVVNGFYDYQAKYFRDDNRYLCPAGLSEADEQYLRELALAAFAVCDCRGWARVDFLRHANGEFVISELNTVPGLTPHSLVPQAAATVGIDFPSLICQILADSLQPR